VGQVYETRLEKEGGGQKTTKTDWGGEKEERARSEKGKTKGKGGKWEPTGEQKTTPGEKLKKSLGCEVQNDRQHRAERGGTRERRTKGEKREYWGGRGWGEKGARQCGSLGSGIWGNAPLFRGGATEGPPTGGTTARWAKFERGGQNNPNWGRGVSNQ